MCYNSGVLRGTLHVRRNTVIDVGGASKRSHFGYSRALKPKAEKEDQMFMYRITRMSREKDDCATRGHE